MDPSIPNTAGSAGSNGAGRPTSMAGGSLVGRLYGTTGRAGVRLASNSPVVPGAGPAAGGVPFGSATVGGASVVARGMEASLVPKPKGRSVAKSRSLEALARARRGESTTTHPLAGSVDAQTRQAIVMGKTGGSMVAGSGFGATGGSFDGTGRAAPRLPAPSLAKSSVKQSGPAPAFARLEASAKAAGEAEGKDGSGRPPATRGFNRSGRLVGGDETEADGKGGPESDAAGGGGKRKVYKTFTESLELSARYMDEFVAGNFLYLRPKAGMERNAYDLETCEHWETEPSDYYTMSRAGITHFVGSDSEFTSLEQWEREYSLFNLIRKIPFFAKYRKWKNFTVWKRNVRAEKMGSFSGDLDGGLFVLNPTLRSSLMALRKLCVHVSTWRLFEYNPEATYTLDEFCDEQAVKRHHVITWLGDFADNVRALVRGACDEVLDKFLADNSIQADHKMTFMERAALRTECRKLTKYIRLADFLVTDTLLGLALDSATTLDRFVRPPVKPKRVIRQGEEDEKKVLTKAERQESPLFVVEVTFEEVMDEVEGGATEGGRLAHIAHRRALKQAKRKRLEDAAKEPKDGDGSDDGSDEEAQEKKKAGDEAPVELDEVDLIDLDDDSDNIALSITPTVDEVKERFKTLLLEAMTVVSAPPRLLTHEDLSPYTQAASEDADETVREEVDLAEVVMADQKFVKTSENINTGLGGAFLEVADFCGMFEPFKNTFLDNMGAMDSVKEDFRDAELTVYEEAISKYTGQTSNFDAIPISADIGIVRVNSRRMKMALMPSPVRCLHAIQELLPELMSEQSEKLLDELNTVNAVISSVPTNVDDFVKKVEVLLRTLDDLPNLRERRSRIMQMAHMMESNNWPIPDSQKAYFTMLSDSLTGLEQACTVSESKLDEDTKRFAQEVDEAVPQLKKDMLAVREKLDHSMIADENSNIEEVLDFLGKREAEMAELKETAAKIQHWQQQLKMEVKDFETLDEVLVDLTLKVKLWQGLRDWTRMQDGWVGAPFEDIDAEAISLEVAQYMKTAVRAERGLPGNMAAPKLKGLVEEFKMLLPVVLDLRNKALKKRHWEEIEEIIAHEFQDEHVYTLGELLELKVVDHQQEISVVTTKAVQESVLEEMLRTKVDEVWNGNGPEMPALEFTVNSYKEAKDIFILGGVDDIVTGLDDSLVALNTILGSRYCAPIRTTVEEWQAKLNTLSDCLDEWLMCQKQWMYLETIFSAPDIQRQLPDEYKKFDNVDKSWKSIMKRTNANPNCIASGTIKGLKEQFIKHNEVLDHIQKSLEDYLETKRQAYPRFYFLSNDELLEILAQTRDPQAVQPHLRKCYDALVRLRFGPESKSIDIHAMISPEGEEIGLGRNLKARGNVEDWLNNVTKHMRESLQKLMKAGVIDYDEKPRDEWVLSHPGQIVATVAQIQWSRFTEAAIDAGFDSGAGLNEWYDQNVTQLAGLTVLVRSNLSKLHRKIIVALVTTDVHARDIVEILRDTKCDTVSNFSWQMQLRYYWDTDVDDCVVRQSNCMIPYGHEYQGCTSRLVITPLTDRCWMTITGAYHLRLGASPAGPAGTGKTESSKDLAKAIAIQCIVFNCSDQIDYKMMAKLFAGLAQAGCWCCLDEFNRIDIEVLSVVAQQLLVLRQGKLSGQETLAFEGRNIVLRDHVVIVTMNPGYAGRTELPDNLKVLFRPVAMMVPDYALIAEIILFAEGFDDAKNLSRKMTRLYRLSSEQLSQQRHYDFGMRAVKSVLVMAGALKRGNPGLSEDVVLIRAMRDSNVPKFLSPDLPLFHAIVGDLFPGVEVPHEDAGELDAELRENLTKAGMQHVELFIEKILQLNDTFNVRFGVVITGPTGAGKSTAYRTLAASMSSLRDKGSKNEAMQHVHYTVLNPKCITMGELYGEFNELTQEWKDGLASTIIRDFVGIEDDDRRWTVFDGPIDALWIENMNTVLDDNMMLCLANGERIKLHPRMRMLFEVQDLEVASPATVSRLGVVYMTPDNLGWEPYVRSWAARDLPDKMPEDVSKHVLDLFVATIGGGITFKRKNCKEPIQTMPVQLATSLCNLFTALMRSLKIDWKRDSFDLQRFLTNMYAFAYVWTIGGSIFDEGMDKFDGYVRSIDEFDKVRFGPGTVYDNFFDLKGEEWRKWDDIVPKFEYDGNVPYFRLVVPTVDTVRYGYILQMQLSQLNPVFFTGVTGTGKTVVISDLLARASSVDYTEGKVVVPIPMNFSARSSSIDTQSTIEAKLQKKRKTLLGAPVNQRVVIFVDDVNMPAVEEYGAQPPIELLRQYCDHRGFYDRQKLFFKDIEDTVLVCAAAPPGGGRNEVTKRFSRHFHMVCLPPATEQVLARIFGSILEGFLASFNKDTQALARPMVESTVEVYKDIRIAMRPTPAKSHYTFNLRDVSKVFQGVLMIRPQQCQTPEVMTRLWIHEGSRVFHDRLTTYEDKRWYTEYMVACLSKRFLKTGAEWSHEALFEENSLLFCDFLRPRVDDGPGIYEEAKDMNKIVNILNDALDDYNMSNPTQMKLVFFRDAVEHICRISRILRQPRGNAMLVGVGGSGKQSLTRMACAIGEVSCVTIELTRGYSSNEFREDLKRMMLAAGVEGKQIAFLFTDTQITDESFLEDVNNVLNTGEVPNLWQNDEMNKIVEDLRQVAADAGIPETRDNVYRLFVARVRDNLHIVLAMSPVGDSLRVRCRQFPSLIDCTTIDWYMPWPKDALLSVSQRFLSEVDLGTDEVKNGVAEMCVHLHKSVDQYGKEFFAELQRKVYTTPKSYLDLINLYIDMLEEKRTELSGLRKRLAIGVNKLEETNAMVVGLQAELTKLQPVLEQKAVETEAMLKQVAVEQKDADEVKAKVSVEEKEVRAYAAEVGEVQSDAQRDLDVAMPALNNAIKALDSLDKKDITEVKSFAKPPPAVQTVMEAICILLGEKPTWDDAKRVLSNSAFMDLLKQYDKDNIPPATLKKIKKYVDDPIMAIDNVKKVSKAATSLCMWVHAMDVYSKVAKEVEPKKKRLAEMNAKLDEANSTLKEKQDQLQAILDRVAELRRVLEETMAEKDRLAHEAQLTKDRLVRAEKLTVGLADEQVRWKASVETFDVQIGNLVGDVLLAAASISYYGAFTGIYRERIVGDWLKYTHELKIPASEDASLYNTLGEPVLVREWQIMALPTDKVSTDNAILVTRGRRWPLMIDPQEQAKRWIKNMEAKNKMEITRMNNVNLLRTLENCIRVGNPLLVEDIGEYLDPALEPVLAKAVFKTGGRLLIHLGDSDIDYDPNFKLYLSTKMPNPHYLPEVCIKVTVINFTVTTDGLEDQLLGFLVKKERPDVEERKNRLVISMAADKKQLQELEDKILDKLSKSEGNILDNAELIATLGESKELSAVISERLKESELTEIEINEMREKYRPVATRGSLVYFVIADLANIDPMYQFSLTYFVRLYNMCIDDSAKSDDLDTRLANLLAYLTENVYTNICRGLFENHKLLFSFLVCVSILRERADISTDEWLLLLRGAGMLVNPKQNPWPDLVPEVGWNLAHALEEGLPQFFDGFVEDVAKNQGAWKAWFQTDEPHMSPMPDPWNGCLNSFQKMLVLKSFKEEKTLFAIKQYVTQQIGRVFVESPPVLMKDIHGASDNVTPIIFVLSVGADPTGLLLSYAKTMDYTNRLSLISLGQGQGPRATEMVYAACKTGDWVLLQNCHLAKSWMPTLEKIVDGLREGVALDGSPLPPIHDDFRLWLTSMPAAYFPVPVLQNGVKLTNEPPKGIRANLMRSLTNISSWTDFDTCEGEFSTGPLKGEPKLPAWKRLSFGVCFFHAITQERRKFGPLGWNILYEFNDTDLETSVQVLKMFLEEQEYVPWDALTYVTGQINYGGRVTDDWDRRCLMSILSRFYDPQILEADYKFSPSGIYYGLGDVDLPTFKEYVSGLPMDDAPEVFGMHENANIAFQAHETSAIIKTCLSIQPRTGGSGDGASPEQIADELAKEIEAKLPGDFLMEEAGSNTFVMRGEHMDSLATVLGQEMARFNKMLRKMRQSLADLQKAIRGEVLMSDELDKMFTSLVYNQVPGNWEAVAYPSLKPLASWVKDLVARLTFIRDWLINGQPAVFWMSGFFFPQGFMTGTLQNHARKYGLAIDQLVFRFSFLDYEQASEVPKKQVPKDGVLVEGLFMDGARFDREHKRITDSHTGEMFSTMPIIHFMPADDYAPDLTKVYEAPTYKTSTRAGVLSTTGISTNYVVAVIMDTIEPPDFWVAKGAALLCQLDD